MNPLKTFVNNLASKSKTTPYAMPYAPKPSPAGPPASNMSIAPKQSVVTSNAGATSPKKVTYTTFVPNPSVQKSQLPPAGQQYAQNLSQSGGLSTIPGPYDAATGKLKNDTPLSTNTGNTPTPRTPTTPESPYLAYLKSMFDPEALKSAYTKSNDANQRLANIQSRNERQGLDARVNYERTLDTPGGLKSGAEQAASIGNRRASAESAYGAIEESAAARTAGVQSDIYNSMINAGKSVYDAEQAQKEADTEANKPIIVDGQAYQKQPDGSYKSVAGGTSPEGFTLGKDQVRYDAQGNVIAGSTSGTGQQEPYIPGADPTVDAWVKYVSGGGDISKVPEEYQNQVIQGSGGSTAVSDEKATQQIDLVKQSLERAKKLADASGRSGVRKTLEGLFIGSTDFTNLVAETNTLRTNVLTMMTDPAIKKFFGPQMSNADVQLMTSAGTTLNPELQSPENMKSELVRLDDLVKRAEKAVRDGLKQTSGGTTGATTGSGGLFDW